MSPPSSASVAAAPDPAQAGETFSLTLKRNCSCSPDGVLRVLLATSLLSAVMGAAFIWIGAGLVLPFLAVMLVALCAAFYLQGRHAADYEKIRIDGPLVRVEIREAEELSASAMPLRSVRVDEHEAGARYWITLGAPGREIEIGRHLDVERRRELAGVLKRQLRGAVR